MTDKNPKQSETQIEDRYLGAVQGNILDAFQNTSYTLKLYMIPDLTQSGGGYLNGAMEAEPGETVVIAQSSVTGVQIDNLSIEVQKGPSGSFATSANFTLIQPGAADLLDQIQAAKRHLKIKAGMFAPVPLFLRIDFKGYTDDINDNEAGGEINTSIAGPYIYKCEIATIDITIDDAGSTYDVSVTIGSDHGYADQYFTLPADTSFTGNTIDECIEDLEETLKRFRENNYKEELVHDEVVFDLSQLKTVLQNRKIKYSNAKVAEQVNRLMNAEAQGIKSREEFEKRLEDSPESLDGGVKASGGWFARDRIQVKEGTNFHKIFTTLLVMNEEFLDKSSRKKVFDDPNIDEDGVDLNKTFTYWYKMEVDAEYIKDGYDARRNVYAQRITYKPIIYKTADQDLSVTPGEFNLKKENVKKRINELLIKKAYHYLYTGLNDQILSADISYKAGQLLLAAPGGGLLGDPSTSSNAPGKPNVEPNKDLDGVDDKAKIAAAQEDTQGIADALKKDSNLMNRLQDKLNLTDDEVKEIQKDKEKRNNLAQTIVYLNNNGQDPLGYYKSAKSTQDPQTKVDEDFSNSSYKPDPSGYIYGADLLSNMGGSETVIGELTSQQALNSLRSAINGDLATDPMPSFDYTKSVQTTSSNTNDGTAKATLFGYMFQNVNDASILVDLNLKVRGDPWYLGPPEVDPKAPKKVATASEEDPESKDEYIVYNRSDNYFLFTMQTPRVRDPDVLDEDNNSGYVSQAGTAYFISGVYQIIGVTANFSRGMFDLDVHAKKQTALSLAKFDLTDVDYEA